MLVLMLCQSCQSTEKALTDWLAVELIFLISVSDLAFQSFKVSDTAPVLVDQYFYFAKSVCRPSTQIKRAIVTDIKGDQVFGFLR